MKAHELRLYPTIIATLWFVIILYWSVSAVGVKRRAGSRPWRKEIALRASVIVVILLLVRFPQLRHALQWAQRFVAASPITGPLGAALCLLGIALAIVARRHLGRNWGMPMTQKAQPELVTSGPYAYIRHPIYTGLILAMLGSTLGASVFWVVPLLLSSAYFIYSARCEEQLMIKLLPEQYASYLKRTNMLLPGVQHVRRGPR